MWSTFSDENFDEYDDYEDQFDDVIYDDYEDDYDASATDEFPYLRSVLAEEYAGLSNEALEDVFYGAVDGVDIDDYENFLKNLSTFSKSAGRVLGQAAPGAISGGLQGATAGAALGPYGALAGGILGAVGGGVQSYAAAQQPQPAAAPAPAAAAPAAAQRPVAQPPAPVAAPGGRSLMPTAPAQSQAATQLMAILQRPETIQAILAVIMGQLGRRTVPVEAVDIPAADVLHTVATLASRAAGDAVDCPTANWPVESDELLIEDAGHPSSMGDMTSTQVMSLMDAASIEDSWHVDDPHDDEGSGYAANDVAFDDDYDELNDDIFAAGRLMLS